MSRGINLTVIKLNKENHAKLLKKKQTTLIINASKQQNRTLEENQTQSKRKTKKPHFQCIAKSANLDIFLILLVFSLG